MAFTVLAATSSGSVVPQRAIASCPTQARAVSGFQGSLNTRAARGGPRRAPAARTSARGSRRGSPPAAASPRRSLRGRWRPSSPRGRRRPDGRRRAWRAARRAVSFVSPARATASICVGMRHREPLLHRVLLAAAAHREAEHGLARAVRDEAEPDLARLALGKRAPCAFVSPWSFRGPVAVAVTSTSVIFPDGACTTTPASTLSPTRASRGSAGIASSGLLTWMLLPPVPPRSPPVDRHRHDPEGGQVVGQGELDLALPVRPGDHRGREQRPSS